MQIYGIISLISFCPNHSFDNYNNCLVGYKLQETGVR